MINPTPKTCKRCGHAHYLPGLYCEDCCDKRIRLPQKKEGEIMEEKKTESESWPTIAHVSEVVGKLNKEYFNAGMELSGEGISPFAMTTDGYGSTVITFLDWTIWDSDVEERKWIDDETIEPLESYIRSRSAELLMQVVACLEKTKPTVITSNSSGDPLNRG